MKNNSLPAFLGVTTSIIVILILNHFTIVDNCLDHGGSFDYKIGRCILANGETHVASFTHYLMASYFILAIVIAFGVSKLINKLLRNKT